MPPADPALPSASPAARIPPRRRWLRRLGWGGLALAGLCVLAWFAWDRHATAQLAAAIAGRAEVGRPVRLDALRPPPIPDRDNAVMYLKRAFADLDVREPGVALLMDLAGHEQAVLDHAKAVAVALERHKPGLAALRAAAECEAADWGISSGTTQDGMVEFLSSVRLRVKALCTAATFSLQAGRAGETAAFLLDALAVTRTLEARPVATVGLFAAAACDGVTLNTLQNLALRLAQAPAAREALVRMIDHLLDEAPLRASLSGSVDAGAADLLYREEHPESGGPARVWIVFRPILQLDNARAIATLDDFDAALSAPTLPEARALLPPPDTRPWVLERFPGRGLSGYRRPDLILPVFYKRLAQRRLAAAGLATLLFHADHGRWPEELADLVPEYLPEVPADPLAAEDRPLVLWLAHDPPRVSSVGEDARDDAGVIAFSERGPDFQQPDMVFLLSDDWPRPPSDVP